MKNLPFNQPGHFWKGNIHTHSTLSDGHLPPEEVCRLYRDLGYDFISLTDHYLPAYNFAIADTRSYHSEGFTTITGAELHTGRTSLNQLWHILAVGLPLDFAPPHEDETGPQIAARALEAGAYVAAAHPAWYKLLDTDILSLGPVDAIEIFNGTSVDHNDAPESWYVMETLLERGHRYFACATDDAHIRPQRADVGLGWVHVKSEDLSPESIVKALKAGHNYSSTGPQIFDIQVAPRDRVYVRCSPASRIFVTGTGHLSATAYGEGVTEAELDISHFKASPYCRITVRDDKGGRAWSNPIWFEG